MWETWVQPLSREDPLEKEMATHSSTLAWKIPWTEKPGRLQPKGLQSWTRLSDFTFSRLLDKENETHRVEVTCPGSRCSVAPDSGVAVSLCTKDGPFNVITSHGYHFYYPIYWTGHRSAEKCETFAEDTHMRNGRCCFFKYLLSQMQLNPALVLPPTKLVPDQATLLNPQQPSQVRVLQCWKSGDHQSEHAKAGGFKVKIHPKFPDWARERKALFGGGE